MDWLHENPGVGSGLFGDVAAFADVIVLAVKGTAANEVLAIAGEDNHAGKPVIDATNHHPSTVYCGFLRASTSPSWSNCSGSTRGRAS